MKLGDKIQQLRKTNGLSQEQLATQLHVSRQAVSKWELGESLPDLDNIVQLCRLFSISTDTLLLDDIEEMEAHPVGRTAHHETNREGQLKMVATAALGLSALGLLISVIGWHTWQTALSASIGLVVQLFGITLFEGMVCRLEAPKQKLARGRFYALACWLIALVPSVFLTAYAFQFYPKPYSQGISGLLPIVLYVLFCGLLTVFLRHFVSREAQTKN